VIFYIFKGKYLVVWSFLLNFALIKFDWCQ
jgi:hypothetical protein